MVPRSWLELYISRVGHDIISPRPLEETDTMIYYQCLLMLVKSFTTVLARIEKELSSGFKFTYNERPYHPTLLQRRNAEFLAVGLFNLPIYLSGVENARTSANTVRL